MCLYVLYCPTKYIAVRVERDIKYQFDIILVNECHSPHSLGELTRRWDDVASISFIPRRYSLSSGNANTVHPTRDLE